MKRPPRPDLPKTPRAAHRSFYADKAYQSFPLLGKCELCGSTERLTRDHIVPLVRGGSNDPSNLRILCRSCNSSWRRAMRALVPRG